MPMKMFRLLSQMALLLVFLETKAFAAHWQCVAHGFSAEYDEVEFYGDIKATRKEAEKSALDQCFVKQCSIKECFTWTPAFQ